MKSLIINSIDLMSFLITIELIFILSIYISISFFFISKLSSYFLPSSSLSLILIKYNNPNLSLNNKMFSSFSKKISISLKEKLKLIILFFTLSIFS